MSENPTPNTPGSPVPPPQGGQPGAQPDWVAQSQGSPQGSGGLDPKVGGLLSYLLFGWIGGLVMFFTQKHPEVRFHAAQSIIVFGTLSVISIVLSFFPLFLGGAGSFFLFTMLSFLINIAAFVLWIVLCIKGYNLEHFKLPVAGDMAEQWAANN